MARGDEAPMTAQAAVMIDPPAVRSVVRVKIAQIDASERLREISEAHAQVIAASMLEHETAGGRRQLQAVELVQRGDGYRLVYGAHRLRAHQINGWEEIDAEIVTLTDAGLRLREIDENLIRHELTALDRARFLSERKRLFEALNPAAKRGGDRRSDQTANVAVWSFSADIAEKTGLSERTVFRAVALIENLAPAAIARLRDTPLASNQAALEALSKQPHERQLAALDQLFAAENPAPSVNAAFDRLDGKAVKPAAELWATKTFDQFSRQSAKTKREFLDLLMKSGAFEGHTAGASK
ncbi:MAG: ParB/RepB/Spo0J family partition protein [Candidatus Brevundimonas colombiensis]|uniref:ParB/RepB/Spo0J family partition protein n=1 Tax=Candidatus Brevundimonas colombiensis TaxID=3121376 RepID=A0AAJ6BIB5_9CAUL|nr:ParB/RepB/Spo0J family partition protein [Brevundimonas sp.]WEK38645.1 MAG: ParB/RepB/Spo0J family partition protein [Brevundimonas sp.]